jgi:hypothetical protein
MKPYQYSDQNEAPLHAVLEAWVVDAPLPPRFRDNVWQQIARAETRSTPAIWSQVLRLIEVVLPRPKFALAYVSALLVLGVAGGAIAAQVKSNRLNMALGQRYVQSIDPYRSEVPQQ